MATSILKDIDKSIYADITADSDAATKARAYVRHLCISAHRCHRQGLQVQKLQSQRPDVLAS